LNPQQEEKKGGGGKEGRKERERKGHLYFSTLCNILPGGQELDAPPSHSREVN
jgi:hypothetical protein